MTIDPERETDNGQKAAEEKRPKLTIKNFGNEAITFGSGWWGM